MHGGLQHVYGVGDNVCVSVSFGIESSASSGRKQLRKLAGAHVEDGEPAARPVWYHLCGTPHVMIMWDPVHVVVPVRAPSC